MLSLTLIFLGPLLAQYAPHTNVQVATDDPQVKFAVMNSGSSFRARPTEPSDPPQNGTGAAPTPSSCPLVMAYYPDWVDDSFQPEDIPYKLLDWIDFAFALPTNTMGLTWDNESTPEKLRRLVSRAHRFRKKVKLSIGGWTGSKYVF